MNHCFVIVCHSQSNVRLKEVLKALRNNNVIIVINIPLQSLVFNWEVFENFKNIMIIENFNVDGIAGGANIGASYAFSLGYKLLTFLDDDSIPSENFAEIVFQNFLSTDDNSVIYPGQFSKSLLNVKLLNHSGLTVSKVIFKKIGGFRRSLFIDLVDYDFGWRLQKNGISMISVDNLKLNHRLGEKVFKSKLLKNISVQSPSRHYFQARNALSLLREYKGRYRLVLIIINLLIVFKLFFLVLTNNEPKKRITYYFRGLCDAK
jgi:rhamnosyltransferase